MAKTANELQMELNEIKQAMKAAEKREAINVAANDSAIAVKAMYDSFVQQGFNETQAYELTTILLNRVNN